MSFTPSSDGPRKNGRSSLLEKLAQCDSIPAALEHLLRLGELTRIRSIRYYRYTASDGTLVSVDGTGPALDSDVQSALRMGKIRSAEDAPTTSKDTFLCLKRNAPMIFVVDETRGYDSEPVALDDKNPVYRMTLCKDPCQPHLGRNKSGVWVDFPLKLANQNVGKFSFDLDPETKFDTHMAKRLVVYWRTHLLLAGAYLEWLWRRQIEEPLEAIQRRASQQRSLADLFHFCTHSLPAEYFESRFASLFLIHSDSLNYQRLVLQATNYDPLRADMRRAFYDLGEGSLTGWIAKYGTALRIHDLEDPELREQQLLQHTPKPNWRNQHVDSEIKSSYLGVPIRTPDGVTRGVIRMTEKQNGREFTERDQRLLERVAEECIGPRIASLKDAELFNLVIKGMSNMSAASVSGTAQLQGLDSILETTLSQCFETEGGGDKAYVINIIDANQPGRFSPFVLGGRLVSPDQLDRNNSLVGTLTEEVINEQRSIILTNIHRAHALGKIRPISERVRSAVASPITFQGHRYGALVVESDAYDLIPGIHDRLVDLIAGRIAEIFTDREVSVYSSAVRGLRHDLAMPLGEIERTLTKLRGELSEPERLRLLQLTKFLVQVTDAYSRTAPSNPGEAVRDMIDLDLKTIIESAIAAAKTNIEKPCRCTGLKEPFRIRGEAAFIYALIYNIIKNAIIHTSTSYPISEVLKGEVRVEAERRGDTAILSVIDNGPGLTHEQVRIFNNRDLMVDIRSVLGAMRQKSGVGLLLCWRLANWYTLRDQRSASIEVERRVDERGSVFRLTIPLPRYS